MTNTELHHPPRRSDVMREQFRAIGISLRLPALALAGLSILVTLLAIADFLRGRGGVEFAPELSLIPAFAGALLPLAVWQSESRFGPGFFGTLPVDRMRHALVKVFAGWLWLVIAVTGFVLWLLILALITKGNITGDEIIKLLPTSIVPPSGTLDPSMLRTVRWIPQRVLWLTPFFASTGMYVMASAFALGLRYPFRWIIGIIAAGFMAAVVSQGLEGDSVDLASGRILHVVLFGKYGLDGLLSAHAESLKTAVKLSNGQWTSVWLGIPSVRDWIAATLLWTSLGLAALTVALMRHREHR